MSGIANVQNIELNLRSLILSIQATSMFQMLVGSVLQIAKKISTIKQLVGKWFIVI